EDGFAIRRRCLPVCDVHETASSTRPPAFPAPATPQSEEARSCPESVYATGRVKRGESDGRRAVHDERKALRACGLHRIGLPRNAGVLGQAIRIAALRTGVLRPAFGLQHAGELVLGAD